MELVIGVVGLLGAAVGFIARSLWDWHLQRRARLDQKRLELIETRLSEFFWPLYFRLQKDNAVWELILNRGSEDQTLDRVGHAVEKDFILPNHREAVELIESKCHLAGSDAELQRLVLAYVRHVAVYDALRTSGVGDDPIAVGEPFPHDFFPLVERRTLDLQTQYDASLATMQSQIRRRWKKSEEDEVPVSHVTYPSSSGRNSEAYCNR